MKRLTVCMLIAAQCQIAHAYTTFGAAIEGGRTVTVRWAQTPRYFVTGAGVSGVPAADFQAAVARAFARWESVPTATIAYQFVGVTNARPGDEDGLSTLGFASHPELDRVLASTNLLVDETTGALVESDIFFNAAFPWSIAPAGEAGRFDLESIATHEIGHFSGLGHSALGETTVTANGRIVDAAEAVMFPIAFTRGSIAGRTLKADDVAGISDVYPAGDFERETGSISGRIVNQGSPAYGAHVVAFNISTGALVAGFTLTSRGEFSIAGLTPGPHLLRVEPLDDADLESFFDDPENVDVGFRVSFWNKLVVVPRGGDSGTIIVAVTPK